MEEEGNQQPEDILIARLNNRLSTSDFALGDEFWYRKVKFECIAYTDDGYPILRIVRVTGTEYPDFIYEAPE